MTGVFEARSERPTYTVSSSSAARSIGAVTMANVTPIVFVVDDDISVRESLQLLVKSGGWHAETFASAHEFLSRPRAAVPCCLVLDVTLPGLNGLDLQQRLSERTEIPIIFITGYGDVPMSVRAMKAGAVDCIYGPYTSIFSGTIGLGSNVRDVISCATAPPS